LDELKANMTLSSEAYFKQNDKHLDMDAGQKADLFDESM